MQLNATKKHVSYIKRNIVTGNILSGSCLCHSISTSGKKTEQYNGFSENVRPSDK